MSNQLYTLEGLIQANARELRARYAAEHISQCLTDILDQALTSLSEADDIQEVISNALRTNALHLKADGLSFWREEPSGEAVKLQMMYAFGVFYTDERLAEVGVPRRTPKSDAPTWAALLKTHKPFAIYDIAADKRITLKKQILDQHVKRMLVVPLLSGQKLIGWSSIFHLEQGEYSEDDVKLAQALAQQATLIAELVRFADRERATLQRVPEQMSGKLLTVRELQVLRLVAEDKSTKEIASTLKFKDTTAKSHVKNILEKLEVTRRGQAVIRARELGLLK